MEGFPVPLELLNFLVALLVGIIGWNVRELLQRVEKLTENQTSNTERLVRIETKLGIPDPNHFG